MSIIAFLVTSTLLAITPGPSVVYTVSYTLRYGALAGIISAVGVNVGSYISIIIAASSTAALAVTYPGILNAIQVVGAFYILYLAYRMWPRYVTNDPAQPKQLNEESYASLFRNGVVTSVLNPKDILFYLAYVSQFIHVTNESMSYTQQFLAFSVAYAVIGLVTKLLFIAFAGRIKSKITGGGALYLNYGASLLLLSVAVYMIGKSVINYL